MQNRTQDNIDYAQNTAEPTEIITFDQAYAEDYKKLNREWIETYFAIEPMDLIQLEDPAKTVVGVGGEIFFIRLGDQIFGTCAMIPHGEGCYELAKMAVSPHARGRGYGDLLMKTAIEWANKRSAQSILLLSNTKLEPAITLYKKHGFVTTHLGPHPDYERCNIVMELKL